MWKRRTFKYRLFLNVRTHAHMYTHKGQKLQLCVEAPAPCSPTERVRDTPGGCCCHPSSLSSLSPLFSLRRSCLFEAPSQGAVLSVSGDEIAWPHCALKLTGIYKASFYLKEGQFWSPAESCVKGVKRESERFFHHGWPPAVRLCSLWANTHRYYVWAILV